VRVKDFNQGVGLVCRSCGYKSTKAFTSKIDKIVSAGAKRASEIGKPLSKKRDPWYYPHTCTSCGKTVYHQLKDIHRVCKECQYDVRNTASGENHPNWNGGRYMHGDGYVVVMLEKDSPYYSMADTKGYILEHRLVMAKKIGRCLIEGEVVHHINGDKSYNKEENLELLPNDASHLPYIILQQHIYKLESTIRDQGKEIKLLKWRIGELEQGNPVPSRSNETSGVRRDDTGGTLDG
jgi:ribosomal protein L37E